MAGKADLTGSNFEGWKGFGDCVDMVQAPDWEGPNKQPEYLVRFKGYRPDSEDYLWLPQRNLEHALDILCANQA